MAIANYIRIIGRGKEGARPLSQLHAHDLMCQILDGRVSDLEVGAFALAMRIKGESVFELAGFLQAAHERCIPVRPTRPTVVMPSYNGARKLPNLTPLLALMLSRKGVQVLVHGPMRDAGRVTTAEIFQELGLPFATDGAELESAWTQPEPIFISTESLCPPLARLLEVRRVIGLRNSGHTVAKLLNPCVNQTSLQVVNYTHPEYAVLLAEFLNHTAANALLLRGTEGEPVADPRRTPKLDVFIGGQSRADLAHPPHDGVLTGLPQLPSGIDALTTSAYIRSVMNGQTPAPAPLTQQVDCLVRALAAVHPGCVAPRSAQDAAVPTSIALF